MNPPNESSHPEDPLEIRIVALLCGEASPEEEKELLQIIEEQPALRQ